MASPSGSSLTPAFLAWAIESRCPVRGGEDGQDPQRVERQLRAARAVGDARRHGWYFTDPNASDQASGLVVRADQDGSPQGFWVAPALSVYGGLHAVEAACRNCPVHVLGQKEPLALAGCYGELPFPDRHDRWHAAVEVAADRQGCRPLLARWRRITRPLWYGLWCDSPLAGPALTLVADLLDETTHVGRGDKEGGNWPNESLVAQSDHDVLNCFSEKSFLDAWSLLAAALRVAHQQRLPVHVQLYPPGRVEGRWWLLPAHCPQCRTVWPQASQGSPPRSGRCAVCDYVGQPAPPRRRCVRGSRPYQPLQRLLNPSVHGEWLSRYPVLKDVLGIEDRASVPPPAMPPGTQQGD